MKSNAILTLGSGALISMGLLAGAVTAAAADTNAAEVQAFMASKGSLSDAVAVAEKQDGGKAMSVEFDNEQGAPMYVVELAKSDGTTQTVAVNPADGTVKNVADEVDHMDNENGENESD